MLSDSKNHVTFKDLLKNINTKFNVVQNYFLQSLFLRCLLHFISLRKSIPVDTFVKTFKLTLTSDLKEFQVTKQVSSYKKCTLGLFIFV